MPNARSAVRLLTGVRQASPVGLAAEPGPLLRDGCLIGNFDDDTWGFQRARSTGPSPDANVRGARTSVQRATVVRDDRRSTPDLVVVSPAVVTATSSAHPRRRSIRTKKPGLTHQRAARVHGGDGRVEPDSDCLWPTDPAANWSGRRRLAKAIEEVIDAPAASRSALHDEPFMAKDQPKQRLRQP